MTNSSCASTLINSVDTIDISNLFFTSEPFKHLFFWIHVRIILSKPSVNDASRAIPPESLFHQSRLSLQRKPRTTKENVPSVHPIPGSAQVFRLFLSIFFQRLHVLSE